MRNTDKEWTFSSDSLHLFSYLLLLFPLFSSHFLVFFLFSPSLWWFSHVLISLCLQLQEWSVVLTGCGLNPERMEAVSISSLMSSSTAITIPFTNPTELPVMVDVTLTGQMNFLSICCPTFVLIPSIQTFFKSLNLFPVDSDKDPTGVSPFQVITDIKVFSIPLNRTEGLLNIMLLSNQ